MCGIFGVINFDGKPVDKEKVLSARDILAHRGPDDSGIYFSSSNHTIMQSSVTLAHRRLSIIDLAPSAHQPMTTEDGRFTIVFNGEIYNYIELSQMSKIKSQKLKSHSDTEVVLYLFAEYSNECLNMLRGMFAFAIWDDKEKKLFAARDRFGIKPFFYLHNQNEFIFSSELKAIKHYKNGLTLSMEGIDAFLKTGSVPAPLTIYEETKALQPGQFIDFDCHPERSRRISINSYWSFSDLIKTHSSIHSFNHTLPLIRTALLDSVKAHLVSDVEVGAFLSGGIDSTAIVSLMRQTGQEKIKTISVTFPGNQLDESKYSNIAVKKYGTDHFEYKLQEDELINDFDKIVDAMDQPTIDGINTYFVSKAAASFGLKVVLSGVGGDELFGGYSSFVNIPKYRKLKSLPFAKSLMKAAGSLLKEKLPAKAIEYFNDPDAPYAEYKLIRGLFTDSELQRLGWTHSFEHPYNHSTMQSYDNREGLYENVWMYDQPLTSHRTKGINDLILVSYLESCFYMRNQLLRDSDMFSMTHSLELRVPFVDHQLYKNVLPFLDNSFDKSFPKKMLVEAVCDLPDEIVHRSKQGFTFPFADWMKSGKIKEAVNDSLTSSKMKTYFNAQSLLNLSNDFQKNKIHWSRVWSIAVLNRFL